MGLKGLILMVALYSEYLNLWVWRKKALKEPELRATKEMKYEMTPFGANTLVLNGKTSGNKNPVVKLIQRFEAFSTMQVVFIGFWCPLFTQT